MCLFFTDCSDFDAESTASENLVRNKLFDIKAVFGSVCCHEFPLKFINLKHGERIAYPVMLIKEQLEGILMKPDLQLHVSYDIACILKRHLESSKQESLLNKISLALPPFIHMHIIHPVSLTDGEQCERLWSYLRCFSAITKEMIAANRKDLLTDALLYYARKKIKKLLLFDDVAEWVQEQRNEASLTTATSTDDMICWQKQYAQNILSNRQLRQSLIMEDGKEEAVMENVALLFIHNFSYSSEKDLKEFEKQHKIKDRWDFGSMGVKEVVSEVIDDERSKLIRKLRVMAFERTFFDWFKKKICRLFFLDGQKLAKSISKNINQKVAAMEKLLKLFNKKVLYIKSFLPAMKTKVIDNRAMYDLDNKIYSEVDKGNEDLIVPAYLKVKA
eukprot:gene2560-2957_t